MTQTAVEFLVSHLTEYGFNLKLHKIEINQAKEMEKQQSNDLAIGFGACLIELLNDSETKTETMKELLEIYKNK